MTPCFFLGPHSGEAKQVEMEKFNQWSSVGVMEGEGLRTAACILMTHPTVSEVGYVEKSSSENSRWKCLLDNGHEGQKAKIQS